MFIIKKTQSENTITTYTSGNLAPSYSMGKEKNYNKILLLSLYSTTRELRDSRQIIPKSEAANNIELHANT